ncbi:hypothetical protein JOB18_019644 [Solea senegalensis]|uniref:Uncharacterized protein n=1 Tax=Solea senegalensis TaxID=28829 RepID=A0AAV6S1Y2_SOLSE|nr:hypothetical protein JOB18_019644 [Solea senegalensis]
MSVAPLMISYVYWASIRAIPFHSSTYATPLLVTRHRSSPRAPWQRDPQPPPPPPPHTPYPRPTARSPDKFSGAELIDKERLRYAITGHTLMECDSMHSLIELLTIKDIHTPRDYIVIFKTAHLHPSPYKVTQLFHDDFMKFSGAYVTNIRPGRKVGDPTVHNLQALQYLADG